MEKNVERLNEPTTASYARELRELRDVGLYGKDLMTRKHKRKVNQFVCAALFSISELTNGDMKVVKEAWKQLRM